jgi:hypothetical protein
MSDALTLKAEVYWRLRFLISERERIAAQAVSAVQKAEEAVREAIRETGADPAKAYECVDAQYALVVRE